MFVSSKTEWKRFFGYFLLFCFFVAGKRLPSPQLSTDSRYATGIRVRVSILCRFPFVTSFFNGFILLNCRFITSGLSLILVCSSKDNKNATDMAKVAIKSDNFTPWGGIFSIMKVFAPFALRSKRNVGCVMTVFCVSCPVEYQY